MTIASLASIKIEHQYFKDKTDSSLELLPSAKTEALLKRYKLRWRFNQGIFNIRSLNKEALPNGKLDSPLIYYLCSHDGLFEQYSDIPFHNGGLTWVEYHKYKEARCEFGPPNRLLKNEIPENDNVPEYCIAIIAIPCHQKYLVEPLLDVRPKILSIHARAFFWKISLIHQRLSTDTNLVLQAENQQLPEFEEETTDDVISGYPVSEFRSKKEIKCRESGYKKLQLRIGDKTIIESLPNPKIQQVSCEGERLYLRSLVYI